MAVLSKVCTTLTGVALWDLTHDHICDKVERGILRSQTSCRCFGRGEMLAEGVGTAL